MTSNESTEPKRSVYDTCDPQYLRELREAAGMDLVVLAKTACLSVAQVRQLETENSDSLFYSEAIKRQAYKRLLMILGAEPPSVEVPEDLRDAGKVAQAHLDTLDQIVAMSHQPRMNRSAKDVLGEQVETMKSHKQVIAALLLLIVAVLLFVMSERKDSEEGLDAAKLVTAVEPSQKASVVTASQAVMPASEPSPVVAVVASQTKPTQVEAPIAPVVPANTAASAAMAAASKPLTCAYSSDAMPQLTSVLAQKDTPYVYLVSTVNAEICAVDANKQATLVQLKGGQGRSVYGPAPWQISGTQLQKVQIFFQGARVSVPDSITHQFKLNQVPIAR